MAGLPLAQSPTPPLDPDQLARVGELAQGLSIEQLHWTSGYLAGLAAAGAPEVVSSETAGAPAARLTILYGSQTGNGRAVAEDLAESMQSAALSVRVLNMADYRLAELARETLLAVVVSTHGEGDPPDDAELLLEALQGPRAPKLDSLRFAVLGLGDSSYEQFCQAGKEFDQVLERLGGRRFAERVDCDLDYAEAAGEWRRTVLDQSREILEQPAQTGSRIPRLQPVPSTPRITRERPATAEVLANQPITGRGSTREVHHIELAIPEGVVYQPGDSLGIWPRNERELVSEIADLAGGPDVEVELQGRTMSLSEALAGERELTLLSRGFLTAYAELIDSDTLRALLVDGEAVRDWMSERQINDVLRQFPPPRDAQALVDVLPGLTPRLYSIASSLEANPGEAHLTVARVRYDAFDRRHQGAASAFLADLEPGAELSVYLAPNDRFRLPTDPDASVIMIGPGTGVAPFRGFLEQREMSGAAGRNWLFFGNPHFDTDFLYQLEWLRWRKQGLLTRLDVAFSRDQADKLYVQHRLRERGAEVFAWLEDGARLYVCGDAQGMAPDVHRALAEIVMTQKGVDEEVAEDYLKDLRRSGRYLKDTY